MVSRDGQAGVPAKEEIIMPRMDIPAIKWGRFTDVCGIVHIAPAIEGYLMDGHNLTFICACNPRIEVGKDYRMVIHEIIN